MKRVEAYVDGLGNPHPTKEKAVEAEINNILENIPAEDSLTPIKDVAKMLSMNLPLRNRLTSILDQLK